MERRRQLRALQLLGGRALTRNILSWSLVALAAIGALGYLLPAHRVGNDTTFHSNFADGGAVSLIVFGGVIACVLALRNRQFGAGIASGVVAMIGAFLALVPVVLAHFLSHVDNAYGEAMFATGIIGLFSVGAVTAIVEPILYITQRLALESEDPVFPTARVVTD